MRVLLVHGALLIAALTGTSQGQCPPGMRHVGFGICVQQCNGNAVCLGAMGDSPAVGRPEPGPCPPGVGQVACTADPCEVARCPTHPDAQCRADYCGGCNAAFYDDDGIRVDNCDEVEVTTIRQTTRSPTIQPGCEYNGQIYPPGTDISETPGCMGFGEYCDESGEIIIWDNFGYGCCERDGQYYEDGETFTEGGVTCTCVGSENEVPAPLNCGVTSTPVPTSGLETPTRVPSAGFCGENSHFDTCGHGACQPTCENPAPICTQVCIAGCQCDDGFALHDGKCIPMTQCEMDTPENLERRPCPPGVGVARCRRNPCEARTCPGHPNATCQANYCGGCNADFFDEDGNEVDCDEIGDDDKPGTCPPPSRRPCRGEYSDRCEADSDCPRRLKCCQMPCGKTCIKVKHRRPDHSPCPPGVGVARCKRNPCDMRTCPGHPNATCQANYCGGCNADFFDEDGNEVVCDETDPPTCPPDVEVFNCFVNPCDVASCPAHPEATCRANYCGGCNAEFFDEDGYKVDCDDVVCAENSHFDSCGHGACQPTCENPAPICTQACIAGCQCDDGFALHDGKCIPMSQCEMDTPENLVCSENTEPMPGEFVKQCEEDGSFSTKQCHGSTGFCYCAHPQDGTIYRETGRRGEMEHDCQTFWQTKVCAENSHFDTCGHGACQPTCENPSPICTQACIAGCQCDDGFALHDGKCIPISQCEMDTPENLERRPCPPGVGVARCRRNPCEARTCPGHPNATCQANYCGGCNADFFDEDGNEVDCDEIGDDDKPGTCPPPSRRPCRGEYSDRCEADSDCPRRLKCCQMPCGKKCIKVRHGRPDHSPCPPGVGVARCKRDPCDMRTCPGHPNATCQANYCGGCNADFFDEDGNEVDCGEAAVPERPGICPAPTLSDDQCLLRVFRNCSMDANCRRREKCCFNGCQKACVRVRRRSPPPNRPFPERPGTCPAPSLSNADCSGPRLSRVCTTEVDCSRGEKCCDLGCGQECVRVRGRETSPDGHAVFERPGTCPAPLSEAECLLPRPYRTCTVDGNCYRGEKCCDNGCGGALECKRPMRGPMRRKPGTCPAPEREETCRKGDQSECDGDPDCPQRQKCCSDGCVMICQNPARTSEPETKCQDQLQNTEPMPGEFVKQCEEDGSFSTKQCHGSTGFCYCAHPQDGTIYRETGRRGEMGHDCQTFWQTRVCGENSHFDTCGHGACQPTCENPAPICTQACIAGCQCDDGFALHDGKCIPMSQCESGEDDLAFPESPGTCPAPSLSDDDCSGPRLYRVCTMDIDCTRGEKCCDLGCGQECTRARRETSPDGLCAENSHFDACGHGACQPTCENPAPICTQACIAGCQCDDGFARHDGKCIPMSQCENGEDDLAFPESPGACPAPSLSDADCLGPRLYRVCTTDVDCSRGEKCCDLGCGQECARARREPSPDGPFPGRPGTCPAPSMSDADCLGPRLYRVCTMDIDCRRGEKCCDNGCGVQECMRLNRRPMGRKPGTCPAPSPLLSRDCTRGRRNQCNGDFECPLRQKCCLDGCVKVCQNPTPRIGPGRWRPMLSDRTDTEITAEPGSAGVAASFRQHGIVPDVIDMAPTVAAEVTYNVTDEGVSVDFGNALTPTQVKSPPQVTWPAEDGALYTLVMTDPDAPSRANPRFREFHHWLVGNIPGNEIQDGETLSQYIGSAPPRGRGLHRYVFLVYRQPGRLEFDERRLGNTSMAHRGRFRTRAFATKYNLGDPVAGNFYQAQWDDWVPRLYAAMRQ